MKFVMTVAVDVIRKKQRSLFQLPPLAQGQAA